MSSIPSSKEEARKLLKDLKARMDAFSTWKEWANDEIAELQDENELLRQRLEAAESRLDIIEDESPGKEGKIRDIVHYASNQRGDEAIIVVTPEEIVGATGVSERYAYQLCDDESGLPSEYHWIVTRQEARNSQYGSWEIDEDGQQKALGVHFERLQSDTEALNKFNNATTEEGG